MLLLSCVLPHYFLEFQLDSRLAKSNWQEYLLNLLEWTIHSRFWLSSNIVFFWLEAYVHQISSGKCATLLANKNERNDALVRFHNSTYQLPKRSISILPDCETIVFNAAKVNYMLSWQRTHLHGLKIVGLMFPCDFSFKWIPNIMQDHQKQFKSLTLFGNRKNLNWLYLASTRHWKVQVDYWIK